MDDGQKGPDISPKGKDRAPEPRRERMNIICEFDDGIIELHEPADDADPQQMLDFASVQGSLTNLIVNPNRASGVLVRHAMDAYRTKWKIPALILPKPTGGLLVPDKKIIVPN